MLRRSVEHSADVGVRTSCTVRVEGRVRCVRDGGEWRDCEGGSRVEDLVRDLSRLYERGGGGEGEEEREREREQEGRWGTQEEGGEEEEEEEEDIYDGILWDGELYDDEV